MSDNDDVFVPVTVMGYLGSCSMTPNMMLPVPKVLIDLSKRTSDVTGAVQCDKGVSDLSYPLQNLSSPFCCRVFKCF